METIVIVLSILLGMSWGAIFIAYRVGKRLIAEERERATKKAMSTALMAYGIGIFVGYLVVRMQLVKKR